MSGTTVIMTRRVAATGACLVVAGAYSWWVATTKPFSTQSDIAVIVGFVMVALVLAAWLRQPRRLREVREDHRGHIWTWVVVIAIFVVVEVSGYFAGFVGGRNNYPTLSYLYDEATRVAAVKAVFVFLWLAIGWGLFHPRTGGVDPRR